MRADLWSWQGDRPGMIAGALPGQKIAAAGRADPLIIHFGNRQEICLVILR